MKRLIKNAGFRVLLAIVVGAALGYLLPSTAVQMKVCADLFINLVRMLIAPIVFLTVVIGMGRAGDLKSVGQIGAKALLYFEVITTFSLVIGIP
jgi:aerobic C4-dicarboxylate transport protein